MDDTHSRTSDAAATRKRRSSILKLQRAPRAPFSELEFNVATPTDTSKSRRVSFSRRTGVAEFATNEATTTWKNFYEEQNKTLESSGNDSVANPPRGSVGHIGKRIFDEQFQEVEVIDFVSTLDDGRGRNIETSLNTANFAEQFATLENTGDDRILTAPQQNFELSMLTAHQSKVFGDDLAISCMGELSDRISVNFSAVQPIGEVKDDLYEIQRDLQTAQSYGVCQGPTVVCPGPFRGGKDLSEYIEVDLNMTNAALRNESDMSITDTIHSPKVENISRCNATIDKKSILNQDWIADKENILVNPYVAPKECENFAINEEQDKVLIFDGKRLTIQSEKETVEKANYRKTLLPNAAPEPTPQRKTIVLNVNDDLPNFVDDPCAFMSQGVSKGMDISNRTIRDGDLSMTQPLGCKVEVNEKRRTILYGNDTGNISITQALSGNILKPQNEKRRTIVYESDSANISVTQALPANIISSSKHNSIPDTTRTIVFKSESGDISVTQAISSNILSPIKSDILSDRKEKRKTIVFEDDAGNISITQAIPSNIILPEKLENEEVLLEGKTFVYDNDLADISITQAVPTNLILTEKESVPERRKTIVYDDDTGNISITQALPGNILLTGVPPKSERRETIVFETDSGDISVTEMISSNLILAEKRKTIVHESGSTDMSVTQAVPSNLHLPEIRKTIVHESGSADTSVTQAVPSNIILTEKRKTIIRKSGSADMSVTQVVPSNVLLSQTTITNVSADMSVPQAVPSNLISPDQRNTIVHETDSVNMSVTQAVPSNVILPNIRKTFVNESDSADMSVTQAVPSNLILPEKRTLVCDSDNAEISMTLGFSSNIIMPDKVDVLSEERKTIVHEDSVGNISITRTLPADLDTNVDNMRAIVSETNSGNISVTQSVSSNIKLPGQRKSKIHETAPADISSSIQPLPSNMLVSTKKSVIDKIIITTGSNIDIISTTSHSTLLQVLKQESNYADLSITESVEANVKNPEEPSEKNRDISLSIPFMNTEESAKRKTIVFDNDIGNVSFTKPIPTNLISIENDLLEKSKFNGITNFKHDIHLIEFDNNETNLQHDVLVYQADIENSAMPKSKINDLDSTNAAPINSSFETMMATSESKQNIIKSSKENMKPGSSTSARLIESDVSKTDNNTKGYVLDEHNIMKPSSVTSFKTIDSDMIRTDSKPVLYEEKHEKPSDTSHRPLDSDISRRDGKPRKSVLIEGIVMKPASASSDRTLDSDICRAEQKSKKSILDDLLDMSNASMTDGIDDKNVMVKLESEHSQQSAAKCGTGDASNDSLFFIMKDSEDESKKNMRQSSDKLLRNQSLLQLEYKGEDNNGIVSDLQNKLLKLKAEVDDCRKPPANRHFETVVSSDLDKDTKDKPNIQGYINFKEANSTKDLLDILSNFTDKEEEENPIETVKVSSKLSVDDKVEIPETRRLSFAPKRQSIVISREDLLSNISIAQAVLQKSRVDVENNDTIDNISDTTTEEKGTQAKKTVQMSKEIVKKLHFDEDSSYSDMSIKSEMVSPLRKTAFGEESYMKENKAKSNVIPTYLKDVSENIKLLMNDLVKPMADVMPFESVGIDSSLKQIPSTCSLQVQANLIASSQIDLDPEPISKTVTIREDAQSQSSGILDATKKTLQSALKTVTGRFSSESSELNAEMESQRSYLSSHEQTAPGRLLVFDQNNPLNNVLLGPIDLADVHGYNPIKSNETLVASDNSGNSVSTKVTFKENENEYDVGHVTTEYRVSGKPVRYSVLKKGDATCDKVSEVSSFISNISKRESIDQAIDTKVEVKDTEANTYIVMKGNKELLDASSSLTLVDDALAQDQFDVDLDTQSQADSFVQQKKSPVRVIYKIDEDASHPSKDSDVTSNDEEYQELVQNVTKAKKRSYSPTKLQKHKHCTLSSLEVTPKPNKKIQRLSDSPVQMPKVLRSSPERQPPKYESDKAKSDLNQSQERGRKAEAKHSPKHKSHRKLKNIKPGTTITVQQLITEYHIESSEGAEPIRSKILESLKNEADMALGNLTPQSQSDADSAGSYASSGRSDVADARSVTTSDSHSMSSRVKGSPMDWQPELLNEMSSKNLVTECESSVNVVAKIDMLPFMGSRDCEWEARGGDAWSFLLLHGRLRLSVRLAHRHENASRSRVRADTRVADTKLETLHHDKQNPVAVLCVRFAREAMQCVVGRAGAEGGGGARAGDVPALLRRCAGVARVALRWGRAMHDAHTRLAFSLSHTGHLALKVANIPLRSVWEVSMRLEMVVDDAREVPWPGAGEVRVAPVVSDVRVSGEEARRALAHVRRDWGHAPTAIWKIFKHLKNKTMDDDLLLGL